MPGVGCEPDIFRLGELHHPAHVAFALHWPPDMRMRRQLDPHGQCVPADLAERVGESLELIVTGTAERPGAHIAFPMRRTERLAKIARECYMIRNGFRDLILIAEVGRLSPGAVRPVDHRDARIIEELLER